jgi:hypothetical protein
MFEGVLTGKEVESLERKRSGEVEFEGYQDSEGGGFEGLDNNFISSFGEQGNSYGVDYIPEYEQDSDTTQGGDKPKFDDGIDAVLHYIGLGIVWFSRQLWGAQLSIKDKVGQDRITSLRMIGANVVLIVILSIGDILFDRSFAFRTNILMASVAGIGYTIAMVIRGHGGISQLKISKGDLRGILNMSNIDSELDMDESEKEYSEGYGLSETGIDSESEGLEDIFGDDTESDEASGVEGVDTEETDGEGFDLSSLDGEDFDFDFSAIDFKSEDTEGEFKLEIEEKTREKIESDGRLSRDRLYDIMMDILPNKTPNYGETHEHVSGSDEFIGYENLILKALASATKKAVDEVDSNLVYARENSMSIFLEMERVHGFTNIKRIQEELEAFLIKGKNDSGVSVEVTLSGNNYLVVILKDIRPVIFLKDVMQTPKVREFLMDKRRRLPTVIGVTEYGEPEMIDFASIESSITTGMARSGKSKSLTSKFGQQMCLNTPKDVQFIIIDPKSSELFKSMSLMPHVAGLHKLDTALDALKDIVNIEGARRKLLLEKNKVNTIAGYNSRFPKHKLPYIWVIADEIMTIKEEYTSQKTKDSNPWREFEGLLTIIFTQLPYVGIKLWGISHRVKSVLSPSLVMNLFYKESIRGSVEQVSELLGAQDCPKTKLRYPGDTAVQYTGSSGKFIKSLLVSFDEEDETRTPVIESEQEGYFWREMSKAFYDIGFEYPERVYGRALNRLSDEEILQEIDCVNDVPIGLDDWDF